MQKIKVSILVPVYNTSPYIEKCVHSIFGQTYENLEIIFVNDCTPDDSVDKIIAIMAKYPQRNNQVKIISHKENQGLAISRNTAVQAATGDYLFHVDSDDFIPLDSVSLLVGEIEKTKADIVYGNCEGIYNQGFIKFPQKKTQDVDEYLNMVLTRRCMVNIWGKIIRRSLYTSDIFLKKNDSFGEDYLTLPKLIARSKKIHFLDKIVYYYTLNRRGSYSEHFSRDKIVRIKECEEELNKWFHSQLYAHKKLDKSLLLGSYYNKAGIIENTNVTDYNFVRNIYPQRVSLKLIPQISLKHLIVLILFDFHLWTILGTLLKLKNKK